MKRPSQIPVVVSFVAAVLSDLILFFALQIELVSRFLCDMAVGFMIVHCSVTNKDTCQARLLKELGIVGNTAQRHVTPFILTGSGPRSPGSRDAFVLM